MAHKEEFPPLLTQGFHALPVAKLTKLCVDNFPLSKRRRQIMAGFEAIYDQAVSLKITGQVWVDGSFLTKKIEPDDIDFIFVIPAEFYDSGTPEQVAFIDWLIDNEDEPKKEFYCHTDVVLSYQQDHPEYPNFSATLETWERRIYGLSVSSKEPKGIAVLDLQGDAK